MKGIFIASSTMSLFISLATPTAYATPDSINNLPWSNRLTMQGLLGPGQIAGFVDDMLPILGNQTQLWYIDGSLMGGQNSSYSPGIGTGIRQITSLNERELILGGFLFGDYQESTHRAKTWVMNPGIELLTRHQEARLLGYIPLNRGNQRYRYLRSSNGIPASTLLDSRRNLNSLTFNNGHTFYDTPVALTAEYGSGVEAEVGQYIPTSQGAWLRGGVYHFAFQNNQNITGVEANIEFYLGKQASLIIQDNYDNQNKNKIALGVRFNLGGPDHTDVGTLSNRMEEPIIRHIARQSYGLVTPVRENFVAAGPAYLLANNVWYFSRFGTNQSGPINLSNCTAQNPCLNLDQQIADGIQTIAPNANLWFDSGTYSLPINGLTNTSIVSLYNGQAIYGRTANFLRQAQGTERPLINGGLFWQGNAAISDMQVTNNAQVIPQFINGEENLIASIGARGQMLANNVLINTLGAADIETFGIRALQATILNSNITVNNPSTNNTAGVGTDLGLSIVGTAINVNGEGPLTAGAANLQGIFYLDSTAINVNASDVAQGAVSEGGTLIVKNSLFNVNAQAASTGTLALVSSINNSVMNINGLASIAATGSTQLEVNSSIFNVTGLTTATGALANEGSATVSNSAMNLSSIQSLGISAINQVTVNQSTFQVNGTNLSSGVFVDNGSSVINNSTFTISGNGVGSAVQTANGNTTMTNSSFDLSTSGNTVAITTQQANISNSSIQVVTNGQGAGFDATGLVTANNSTINVTAQGNAAGISAQAANLNTTNIVVSSNDQAIGVTTTGDTAINLSNLTITGPNGAAGVNALNINAQASQINAISTTSALGLNAINNILFSGNPSFISATGATAQPTVAGGTVTNNSTPKSQCSQNGGASTDCA